jgi:hypothetical protein
VPSVCTLTVSEIAVFTMLREVHKPCKASHNNDIVLIEVEHTYCCSSPTSATSSRSSSRSTRALPSVLHECPTAYYARAYSFLSLSERAEREFKHHFKAHINSHLRKRTCQTHQNTQTHTHTQRCRGQLERHVRRWHELGLRQRGQCFLYFSSYSAVLSFILIYSAFNYFPLFPLLFGTLAAFSSTKLSFV